ncbi:MAG: hypothetical protein FJ315_06555, partial [SAR202 cluster bacterium]|nr:hypothetical protein [SAR202 cluster bacterium]
MTPRALAAGLGLTVLLCWWVAYSEIRTTTTEITCTSLPIGVLFLLFCVCCGNLVVNRLRPRWALSGPELAVIYILMAVGSAVSGIGLIGFMTPSLAAPAYFGAESAGWDAFQGALKPWLVPTDRDALRTFFAGNSTLYDWRNFQPWAVPLTVWGLFLVLLFGTTLCLCTLLRRQWVQRERLAFPIVELPLEMTARRGGFRALLANRAFQIGFLIPCLLQSLNSLNYLYPSLPALPVKPTGNGPLDLGPLFKDRPWNSLGYFPLGFHPSTIGLSFLLAVEVSFSCWFFYLLRKLEVVFCVAVGWGEAGTLGASAGWPRFQEQGAGAWLAIGLTSLWLARSSLGEAVRNALRPPARPDPAAPMSDRAAVVGFLAGGAGLIAFAMLCGMRFSTAALLMGGFLVLMVALCRLRAEAGMAWHFGPWLKPYQLPVRFLGTHALEPAELVGLANHGWYNLEYRST